MAILVCYCVRLVQLFAEINHDGTLRVQKKRRKPSSNEKASSAVDAAKRFLEEVKMEEKEDGVVADNDDDEMEKKANNQHALAPTEGEQLEGISPDIRDKQVDSNEDTVTCNEVAQHKQRDSNEGSVTCNEIAEDNQNDLNEGSVICIEIIEDKQNDPNESPMTYNKEETNPTNEAVTQPCNGELSKEQVEITRSYEKSKPPANFLSGTVTISNFY